MRNRRAYDWISVSERLPAFDEYVVTYGIDECEIARYEPGSKLWFNRGGRVIYADYWRPLPEPPDVSEA